MRCARPAPLTIGRRITNGLPCLTLARATNVCLASMRQVAELEAKLRMGALTKREQAKLGPSMLAEAEAAAVARENAVDTW